MLKICNKFYHNVNFVHRVLPLFSKNFSDLNRKLDESAKYLASLDENKRKRAELAAAYRGFKILQLSEGVCNHISVLAPSADDPKKQVMLLVPYGLDWSEVTASCLVGLNENNEVVEGDGMAETSAMCIHRGIYKARGDVGAVIHLHPPYATSLALLKKPELRFVHQSTAMFHKKVVYDRYFGGLANFMEEGIRLGTALGSNKHTMIMGNHGVLTATQDLYYGYYLMYYLERVSMFQVLAESTGKELQEIPFDILEKDEKKLSEDMSYAKATFYSMFRHLYVTQPDFLD